MDSRKWGLKVDDKYLLLTSTSQSALLSGIEVASGSKVSIRVDDPGSLTLPVLREAASRQLNAPDSFADEVSLASDGDDDAPRLPTPVGGIEFDSILVGGSVESAPPEGETFLPEGMPSVMAMPSSSTAADLQYSSWLVGRSSTVSAPEQSDDALLAENAALQRELEMLQAVDAGFAPTSTLDALLVPSLQVPATPQPSHAPPPKQPATKKVRRARKKRRGKRATHRAPATAAMIWPEGPPEVGASQLTSAPPSARTFSTLRTASTTSSTVSVRTTSTGSFAGRRMAGDRKHVSTMMIRSPLAAVRSRVGRTVREKELTEVLEGSAAHGPKFWRKRKPGPLMSPLMAASMESASGLVAQAPALAPLVLETSEDGEDDVDAWLNHAANDGVVDMLYKSQSIVDLARHRLNTGSEPVDVFEEGDGWMAHGEAVQGGDPHTELPVMGPAGRDTGAPAVDMVEAATRHAEESAAAAAAAAAAERAANAVWQEEVAAKIIGVFRSDMTTWAQLPSSDVPEESVGMFFRPSLAGTVSPTGSCVPPMPYPKNVMRKQLEQGMGGPVSFSEMSEVTARGKPTAKRFTSLPPLNRPSTASPLPPRVGTPEPEPSGVACPGEGVPLDRHGKTMRTTRGGGGNAAGVAKQRNGPFPIWFAGDGAAVSTRAKWCGVAATVEGRAPAAATRPPTAGADGPSISSMFELPPDADPELIAHVAAGGCVHNTCHTLAKLENGGKYDEYVDVLRRLMAPSVQKTPHGELEARQWRQLVVVAVVFVLRYIEEERFGKALTMIRTAESLVDEDLDMVPNTKRELVAFIGDASACYYFHRSRWQAALDALNKATRAHKAMKQWDHVAKCMLHTAVLLSKRMRHVEALATLNRITAMVDAGKLEVGGVNARKLCLMTVLYHNLAVEHVLMDSIQDAVACSQASRRLGHKCISYAEKYREHMDATHEEILRRLVVTDQIKTAISDVEHKEAFAFLSKDFFSNY